MRQSCRFAHPSRSSMYLSAPACTGDRRNVVDQNVLSNGRFCSPRPRVRRCFGRLVAVHLASRTIYRFGRNVRGAACCLQPDTQLIVQTSHFVVECGQLRNVQVLVLGAAKCGTQLRQHSHLPVVGSP